MKNGYGNGGPAGGGYELDILEIMFLVFSAIFALFYFTEEKFKYAVNSFYIFMAYSLKVYTPAITLYAVNLFFFLAGAHGIYVRIFEIRITGSKLKMYDKLNEYNEKRKGA